MSAFACVFGMGKSDLFPTQVKAQCNQCFGGRRRYAQSIFVFAQNTEGQSVRSKG
jgi:hypothetical protein